VGRLVWFEAVKTFTKLRTYIGFLAFGVLVPLVVAGLRMGGQRAFERNLLAPLEQDFIIGGNVLSGWFFGFFFLGALWVHVPIVLTLVAGDQIAGEGNAGTFRFLLTRAVSRTRIITAKFLVTLLYTALMVLFIGTLTLGSPWPFSAEETSGGEAGNHGPSGSGPAGHFLLAWGLAILSMFVVSALCFLFSAFTDNSIGPIVATMAVIIISLIIITLPFDLFQAIRPWLFVNYFDTWQKVFADPVPWDEIMRNVWILLGFTALFFSATLAWFSRKDILS
jgi:ABC-2 type transport system permease protein